MGLLILNLVLTAFATMAFFASPEYDTGFSVILAVFWVVQAVGAFLADSKQTRRAGFVMVCVGCFPFVPLGLLGIVGARRMIRAAELNEQLQPQAT
ncbi:MAG: hypothetical protein ACE37F_00205 [Nannocystaceae bacterium]|nr:hypothetical protein [bacterium]